MGQVIALILGRPAPFAKEQAKTALQVSIWSAATAVDQAKKEEQP